MHVKKFGTEWIETLFTTMGSEGTRFTDSLQTTFQSLVLVFTKVAFNRFVRTQFLVQGIHTQKKKHSEERREKIIIFLLAEWWRHSNNSVEVVAVCFCCCCQNARNGQPKPKFESEKRTEKPDIFHRYFKN